MMDARESRAISLPAAISPFLEMGSYECLWQEHKTFRNLSEFIKNRFAKSNIKESDLFDSGPENRKISDLVEESTARRLGEKALAALHEAGIDRFGVRAADDVPQRIMDASHPPYCLYYEGFWNLMESPCISVVGTRKPSEEGCGCARRLVKKLVKDGYTIVSGLASGIDTVAHETAIEEGGLTIAVIGTPLKDQYPKENQELRRCLAERHLVITQFPVFAGIRPGYFSERNKLMSAISEATVIVEAGPVSGTQVQAKAALQQGRKLFILDSCFKRKDSAWPKKFEQQGAVRVRDYDDIKRRLEAA